MVIGSVNMGGAQAFLLNLLRNMDFNRYQVDFVVNFEERAGSIGDELRAMGCNIYTQPYFKVYNYWSFVKAWRRFLKENHYDIVHGHSTNSASVYLKIAKEQGCVTIAHCHSAGFRGGKLQKFFKSYFIKKIRTVADYWFACSSVAAEHLYGKGYDKNKNYYDIPNAINAGSYLFDKEIRMKIRKEIGVDDDVFLCGHVGSFTGPKNHLFLLDIYKALLTINKNTKLICCGAGPLMPQVKEKAQSLGIIDNVFFPGIVKNCNEYMMAMDALIFPSLFEGFPVTVIEAEATGLPIVMSDVITHEVDITDCVQRMSLTSPPIEWAREVCNVKNNDRSKYNHIIVESKYNMRTSVKMIMSLYDEMVK